MTNIKPRRFCIGTSFFRIALPLLFALPLLGGCQSKLIYFPEREIAERPPDKGLSYEEVAFRTEDGEKLAGWWIPSPKERAVVLYCHGNGGNISHRLSAALFFHRMDLSVFLFDYRGYGESSGRPSEDGTYTDALGAWDCLVNGRGVDPQRIILYGRSLGGPIAAWLAKSRPPEMLVIESSFTSLQAVARDKFPWLPVGLILSYRYDTKSCLEQVRCPVLIVHSREDGLIPFKHGEELYRAAPGEKEFLEIGGTHNGMSAEAFEQYKAGLSSFIERHLGKG